MALTLEQGAALEAITDFLRDQKSSFSSSVGMPERGRPTASSTSLGSSVAA